MHQNRVASSHSTLEIYFRQFQTVNILCKLLRRLHVKTTQQIQPIVNYWLTHSLQNLKQMYFTYLTISILKIITHIPTVTASPLTHGLPIFFMVYNAWPSTEYTIQIRYMLKTFIRHQLSTLLEDSMNTLWKNAGKYYSSKPTIQLPLLTIPFVTTFGVINENNFYNFFY